MKQAARNRTVVTSSWTKKNTRKTSEGVWLKAKPMQRPVNRTDETTSDYLGIGYMLMFVHSAGRRHRSHEC